MKHFGVNLKDTGKGFNLTRENYVIKSKYCSYSENYIYTDGVYNSINKSCMYNLEVNLEYMKHLSYIDFNTELNSLLSNNKNFEEVTDINSIDKVSGCYIMVLDNYKQMYIGSSKDMKTRIMKHWSVQDSFDTVVYRNTYMSIMSIDGFRALDTTRIFVYKSPKYKDLDLKFINMTDRRYRLNRMYEQDDYNTGPRAVEMFRIGKDNERWVITD